MTEWAQQQRQQIEVFGKQLETARVSTLEFWKHLTLIEATILGLSVGLAQGASGSPSGLLIATWVVLLLSIAVGCLLIKIWIDLSLDGSIRGFRFAHDTADIQDRVARGDLPKGSEEHIGLAAAAVRASSEAGGVELTPTAKKLADKYAEKLSTAYITLPKHRLFVRLLHAHWQGIANAFYGVSGAAFLLLMLSVVIPSERPAAAPTLPPHARAGATTNPSSEGAPQASPAVTRSVPVKEDLKTDMRVDTAHDTTGSARARSRPSSRSSVPKGAR